MTCHYLSTARGGRGRGAAPWGRRAGPCCWHSSRPRPDPAERAAGPRAAGGALSVVLKPRPAGNWAQAVLQALGVAVPDAAVAPGLKERAARRNQPLAYPDLSRRRLFRPFFQGIQLGRWRGGVSAPEAEAPGPRKNGSLGGMVFCWSCLVRGCVTRKKGGSRGGGGVLKPRSWGRTWRSSEKGREETVRVRQIGQDLPSTEGPGPARGGGSREEFLGPRPPLFSLTEPK